MTRRTSLWNPWKYLSCKLLHMSRVLQRLDLRPPREVHCLVPEACWQSEGEPESWPWRAVSDLGWSPLRCGCHENLNGEVEMWRSVHSGQKGLCLSVINYSVVQYPWSQSKMGKWIRLQGPRTPLSSWLGSRGHCLQLDMLESWLRPVVFLICKSKERA